MAWSQVGEHLDEGARDAKSSFTLQEVNQSPRASLRIVSVPGIRLEILGKFTAKTSEHAMVHRTRDPV